MTVYIVLIVFAIIGSFIKNKNPNIYIALCLLVFMGLMVALRGPNVGVDTDIYLAIYKSYYRYKIYSKEFLFYIIVDFFYRNHIGANWCQFFFSIITYIPLCWVILTKTKNACLAVLVFIISVNGYFFETFNITRQAAATSFLLCAYIWLEEKKLNLAIIAIIAAVGMHTSSIIYLPLILVAWKVKISTKFVYYAIGISLLFAFVVSSVEIITKLISYFTKMEIGGTEKYEHFVNYRLNLARNINGLIPLLLPFNALCLYAYNYYKDHFTMKLFFLGVVFLNVVSIMPTSYRMAYGMTCVEILLYPVIFTSNIQRKWIPFTILTISIIYFFWKLQNTLIGASLIPYEVFYDNLVK